MVWRCPNLTGTVLSARTKLAASGEFAELRTSEIFESQLNSSRSHTA
jgi:hypothetical protein